MGGSSGRLVAGGPAAVEAAAAVSACVGGTGPGLGRRSE